MSIIAGIEVTRPKSGTIRIDRRGQAKTSVIWGGSVTIVFFALLAWGISRDFEGPTASDFLCCLSLWLVPGLLVFLLAFGKQIDMLLSYESLAFTCGAMTVEHNGRPTARYSVAGILINTAAKTDSETGSVYHTHTLFVLPQSGGRLSICEASDAEKGEMIDLARELAGIVGVEVTPTYLF